MRTVAITTYETESWWSREKCFYPFRPRLPCCGCTGPSNVADWFWSDPFQHIWAAPTGSTLWQFDAKVTTLLSLQQNWNLV